jgi:hypothetical protein
MRRALLVVCLAGCGDNAPVCGHLELLDANRNIWGGQIAVDEERVYYSDYNNGIGTRLVFRQPRDGGQPLVIAARGESSQFGFVMVVADNDLYWAAQKEPAGYSLLATPRLGGTTVELTPVSECTVFGVAVDATNAYAGSVRCNNGVTDIEARVTVVPRATGTSRVIWSSTDADVYDVVAIDGAVFVATTAGLLRVTDTATETLDGRSTYHIVVVGDELIYSTEEAILARSVAGGAPQTLYTFHTSTMLPRAFAVDGSDLYIAEPPEMYFLPRGGEPSLLVDNMGGAITHIVARDGYAYWATLALPGSIGLLNTYSGGVLRVARPCQ